MSNVTLYTDGACRPNPGSGGWGVAVLLDDALTYKLYGGELESTNQRMELTAAIKALEFARDSIDFEQHRIVTVVTDSNYVRLGITRWIKAWHKNGWRTSAKSPVKNEDLWRVLDALNSDQIRWRWVRGHNLNRFNDLADSLAAKGLYESKEKGEAVT